MPRIHYMMTTYAGQAACGRYADSIATIATTADTSLVTCLACLSRMTA